MHDAAIAMDFLEAAKLRDYLFMLEKITNFKLNYLPKIRGKPSSGEPTTTFVFSD